MPIRSLVPLLAAAALAAEADPDAAFAQSIRCERAGNYVGARAALAPLERQLSNDYLYQARMGWLALCVGDFQAAIGSYRAAQRIEPASFEPRLGTTRVFLAWQHWSEADSSARQLLQSDPGNYTGIMLLASAMKGEGHADDARRELQPLIDRYPTDVAVLSFAAVLAADSGQTDDARALRATIARLEPDAKPRPAQPQSTSTSR
jgi:cytochrome c-type biogenesis protein CcmH/NrfG